MSGACKNLQRSFSKFPPSFGKMPKPKSQKSKSGKVEENSPRDIPSGPVTVSKDGNISIKILAKPGAKTNNITVAHPLIRLTRAMIAQGSSNILKIGAGSSSSTIQQYFTLVSNVLSVFNTPSYKVQDIGVDAVGVQINAPPMEGEANTELVRYLSGVLGLRKSDVVLDKGSRSRQKTIVLQSGSLSVSEVIEKLKLAIDH